ncbi:MAG: aminodeoxychorismate lyase [Gammaproteobacteria bacterium]|nr:aminodeoxychorismate lyase [Gammaproteobacteria bacterium]MDP2141158.1 aminodeoxychorismate lyase [Gammaproteobacteria bacterium]MDP2349168.1 aminodeoxychorismate lyase [Gammaproteobacteria bacterium]
MLVNGQPQDHLPISDRGLHYGDGVFETIRVRDNKLLLWDKHLARLTDSCARLCIPCAVDKLKEEIAQVLNPTNPHGILKIIVTRGSGGRGYFPPDTPSATRIVQLHSLPPDYDLKAINGIRAMICTHPASSNSALAGIKHLNRIDQVMASMELSEGMDEGFMCNESGYLIEGTKSNVFFVEKGAVITPDLTSSGVAGIMRAVVIDLVKQMKMDVTVRNVALGDIRNASELFVCNSVFGIWPVASIEWAGDELQFDAGNTTRTLQSLLRSVF